MTVQRPFSRQRPEHAAKCAASMLLLVLLLPACASRYQVYWGDVHGHTSLSDGKGTPDEYFDYARNVAILDFAILTDHDFGTGPNWNMSREAWNSIQDAADAHTVDDAFVAIAGYEWTSQRKYWTDRERREPGLALPFDGPAMYYNHKNVYFLRRMESILPAHDPAYASPDQLAEAVRALGGLIHNNHPSAGQDGRDQWRYDAESASVIANTEMAPDIVFYEGKGYVTNVERTVGAFLNDGGRTGFVSGSDTHEGHPEPRTAVLATNLSRAAIFEALRARRCYATSGARIKLNFQINGHLIGEEIEIAGSPRLTVSVVGTDEIEVVEIIRNGDVLRTFKPSRRRVRLRLVDRTFAERAWYYVRVTQRSVDEHGNPHRAWSSPIWVRLE